jgi:hypothetical protein
VDQTNNLIANITSCLRNDCGSFAMEEGTTWQDADRHFCAMVGASKFIQGNGGYSYLAERVRTWRGLETVGTLVTQSEYTTWLEAEKETAKEIEKEVQRKKMREQLAIADQKAADERAEEELRYLLHYAEEVGALPDI